MQFYRMADVYNGDGAALRSLERGAIMNLYQEYELEAYLGEHIEDFDVEAIVDEATEIDYKTGNRYWKDGIDLAEICAKHER